MGNPVKVSAINYIQQYLTHSAKADSIIANEKTYSEVIRDMVRKQIRFRGKVQGVGFRYHAKNAASSLGLTGWVRNESDGSVYMEVQGEDVLCQSDSCHKSILHPAPSGGCTLRMQLSPIC